MNTKHNLLLTDSLKYSITKILPGIMGLISVIVIIKMIGTEEYGKYSILNSFIMTLTAFSGSWLNQSLLRYYPGNSDKKKNGIQFFLFLLNIATTGIFNLLASAIAIRSDSVSIT